MNTETELNAVELNKIQDEWMKLPSDATESEKQRVFALMATTPNSYITLSGDGRNANIMHKKCFPDSANGYPVSDAIAAAKALGYRTDVAWQVGRWVTL
ncbi:MAG: hypothetical protein GY918_04875 [Gammaproteobacteria bacterium]|nr:hypothetical protein [Gammaproteobacteria bacterium]